MQRHAAVSSSEMAPKSMQLLEIMSILVISSQRGMRSFIMMSFVSIARMRVMPKPSRSPFAGLIQKGMKENSARTIAGNTILNW